MPTAVYYTTINARRTVEEAEGCAICNAVATVADHDHETRLIRGPLCHGCNNGLGRFRDDPALLRAAAAYLEVERTPLVPAVRASRPAPRLVIITSTGRRLAA